MPCPLCVIGVAPKGLLDDKPCVHLLFYSHVYFVLLSDLVPTGTLHRNELSGALTGLTRVRRFQQDDGHIFCRKDQIKDEVLGALDFMRFVYSTFGMTYKLELSTRPAKVCASTAAQSKSAGGAPVPLSRGDTKR